MSRWVRLLATTPSGKTQFMCRYCGRKSLYTDKECKDLPILSTGGGAVHPLRGRTCRELGEVEEKRVRTSIVWNAIPRAEALAERVAALPLDTVTAIIRDDRLLFLDFVAHTVSKLTTRVKGDVTALVRLEEALRFARTELERK